MWVGSRRFALCSLLFADSIAIGRQPECAVQVEREEHCPGIAYRTGHVLLGTLKLINTYCLLAHDEDSSDQSKRDASAALADERQALNVLPQELQYRARRDVWAKAHRRSTTPVKLAWLDPLYPKQWYLIGGAADNYDLNVREAWHLGYTGKGSVVTVVDDGIQINHPDLSPNYVSRAREGCVQDIDTQDDIAGTDIIDSDGDPTPTNDGYNQHGTRCAGEVAAVAGNTHCGVGIAPDARIGGPRFLIVCPRYVGMAKVVTTNGETQAVYNSHNMGSMRIPAFDKNGDVGQESKPGVRLLNYLYVNVTGTYVSWWYPLTDCMEAAALSWNRQHIDIYSNSWGPSDGGQTVKGPGPLTREALQGRRGLGSVFVWAAGNGGLNDSCSCDGYMTSIHTIGITGVSINNSAPDYGEACPSIIAAAYTGNIVSTDSPIGCTEEHDGTSAAAPLAAGIIALMLDANRNLTWRDVQHIIVRTANPYPLLHNPGWSTNGVGRRVSSLFGYGLMDAGAAVKLAAKWLTSPVQHLCTYEYDVGKHKPLPLQGWFNQNFTITVDGCSGDAHVRYLEHVQAAISIKFLRRGDIKLSLISPSGTKSVLLRRRPLDMSDQMLDEWPFLTMHMWGEDPRGQWTLTIENTGSKEKENTGKRVFSRSLIGQARFATGR